jgi:hypothetical protein
VLASGLAGIALTAALSLPAGADQPTGTAPITTAPTTTTAPPTSTPPVPRYIDLTPTMANAIALPGNYLEFVGPCNSVKGNQPPLRGATFLAPGMTHEMQRCLPYETPVTPVWHATVSKNARDGVYYVSYVSGGITYGARVTVIDGRPPVTKPTQPTSPVQPTQPTTPTTPSQQVPVKPKGAPQTGGGGLADVVSTWR